MNGRTGRKPLKKEEGSVSDSALDESGSGGLLLLCCWLGSHAGKCDDASVEKLF